jgi:hypothetical protein
MGNVYNWGDVTMADPPALRQRGSVFLYLSNRNPSEVIPTESPPSMRISVDVFNSSKPLFEALGKKYPEVTNNDYVIFVYDVIWALLGSYGVITSVDGDEDVTWHTENNKPVLHVLLVCLNLFPTELKSNRTIEHLFFIKHSIQHHIHLC